MPLAFQEFTLLTQSIIIYSILINVVTFFLYGADKSLSYGARRRVSEKTLWFFAFIGGSLGAIAAMMLFRHKTKKISFQFVLFLIVLIHAAILVTYLLQQQRQSALF